MLWGAAGALAIIVNGARLFNSYFIQVYPPLTLLATWALIDSDRRDRWRRVVAIGTGVAVVVLLVHRHYVPRVLETTRADLAALRGDVERAAYLERFGGYANRRGYSARANAELADYLRAHCSSDERIFLFGINGADVYFQADRLPAHRFLRVNFFVPSEFPDPRFTLDAVIAELRQSRPRYLIFERLNAVSQRGAEMGRAVDALQQHPSILELLAGYARETEIEDFTLYRRVD